MKYIIYDVIAPSHNLMQQCFAAVSQSVDATTAFILEDLETYSSFISRMEVGRFVPN